MNATGALLYAVFLAVAALDWVAVHTKSKRLEYLCKPGCMLVLIAAAAALDVDDSAARDAVIVALAFSAIGDVFLMVRGEKAGGEAPNAAMPPVRAPEDSERIQPLGRTPAARSERADSSASLFIAGLGSFLLAHVAYVVAFSLVGLDRGPTVVGAVLAVLLVAIVGRRVVRAVRRGDEPGMATPVSAYIGVISLMVLTAVGTGDGRAAAGAVLFALSDSLIAEHRFLRERAWQPMAIIVTYHVAQALLVWSLA